MKKDTVPFAFLKFDHIINLEKNSRDTLGFYSRYEVKWDALGQNRFLCNRVTLNICRFFQNNVDICVYVVLCVILHQLTGDQLIGDLNNHAPLVCFGP